MSHQVDVKMSVFPPQKRVPPRRFSSFLGFLLFVPLGSTRLLTDRFSDGDPRNNEALLGIIRRRSRCRKNLYRNLKMFYPGSLFVDVFVEYFLCCLVYGWCFCCVGGTLVDIYRLSWVYVKMFVEPFWLVKVGSKDPPTTRGGLTRFFLQGSELDLQVA